jgi:hypothetical protein
MPTITTEVQVDVDLEDIDTDELIDEIEDRGFSVISRDEATMQNEAIVDDIHNLYQDFILWNDTMMADKQFGILTRMSFDYILIDAAPQHRLTSLTLGRKKYEDYFNRIRCHANWWHSICGRCYRTAYYQVCRGSTSSKATN